jgi:hypothetical protein
MTGTKDELLAVKDRELDLDSEAASNVLQRRATDIETYNGNILELARPVLRELVVLYAAMLTVDDEERRGLDVLTAVAMALNDPRLTYTLKKRVARILATLATEAARQSRAPNGEPREIEPLTGRG